METVLRVFQVFLALGLIGVVLLQRSEGGGLGIGSSGGAGSFMSVRGTANLLTRVTAILAALFMVTCLALVLMSTPKQATHSIFDSPPSSPAIPASPAGQVPPPAIPPANAPVSIPPVQSQTPPPAQAPVGTPAPANGAAPRGQ